MALRVSGSAHTPRSEWLRPSQQQHGTQTSRTYEILKSNYLQLKTSAPSQPPVLCGDLAKMFSELQGFKSLLSQLFREDALCCNKGT